MQFRCACCATLYRIGDEKLRGRVLTIRCVRCQELFSFSERGVAGVLVEEIPWGPATADDTFEQEVDRALKQISAPDPPDEVAPWDDARREAAGDWNVVYLPGVRPPPLPAMESDFSIEVDESAIEAIALHPAPQPAKPETPPGLRLFAVSAMVVAFLAVTWTGYAILAEHRDRDGRVAIDVSTNPATDISATHIPREIVVIDLDREEHPASLHVDIEESIFASVARVGGLGAQDEGRTLRRRDSAPRVRAPESRALVANPADLPEPELALKPVVVKASLDGEPSVAMERTPPESPIAIGPAVQNDSPTSGADSARALSVFRSRYLQAVNRCYESARRIEPDVAGRINVTMQIDPSGRIQSLELSQLQNTVFARCLGEQALGWRFPEMPRGTVIAYSLNLVPL